MVCRSTGPCLKKCEQGVMEIFLPEIDCDAKNGVTVHSGFWQVMYSARIHGRIISEILRSVNQDLCQSRKISENTGLNRKRKTPRPGLEPGSKDPQSFRMSTTLPGHEGVCLPY